MYIVDNLQIISNFVDFKVYNHGLFYSACLQCCHAYLPWDKASEHLPGACPHLEFVWWRLDISRFDRQLEALGMPGRLQAKGQGKRQPKEIKEVKVEVKSS